MRIKKFETAVVLRCSRCASATLGLVVAALAASCAAAPRPGSSSLAWYQHEPAAVAGGGTRPKNFVSGYPTDEQVTTRAYGGAGTRPHDFNSGYDTTAPANPAISGGGTRPHDFTSGYSVD